MDTVEIKYRNASDYMASFNKLLYITLALVALAFVSLMLVVFALLPGIYLFMQWRDFGKKAGKTAFVVSPKGIKNAWMDMPWAGIKEVRIEKFARKHDLTFIYQPTGAPTAQHYRYPLNELEVIPEELYNIINQHRPVELVKQAHVA